MTEQLRPAVGVAVLVQKDDMILLGADHRKADQLVYGVPGGHWESGETLRAAGVREVAEEAGITCVNLELVSVYDFYREDRDRSYLSVCFKADYLSGELRDNETEGRLGWRWYQPEEALKLELYPPDKVFIRQYLRGVIDAIEEAQL